MHLFECLPGIPDEQHISSVPLIWMKGSTAARIKTSFSHFVTLSCKMSLLKSVPELWLPSSVGISPFSWLSASRESHLDEREPLRYLFRHTSEKIFLIETPSYDSDECHVPYPLRPGRVIVLAQMKLWRWELSQTSHTRDENLSFSDTCWGLSPVLMEIPC